MHFRNCNSDPIHLDDPIFPSLRFATNPLYYQLLLPAGKFPCDPSPFLLSRQLTATFTFYAEDFTHFTAGGSRARRGLQTPTV